MTPQQKLKEVVEATGGCWHDSDIVNGDSIHIPMTVSCSKCGVVVGGEVIQTSDANPSTSDLNALFDLAEKLGYRGNLSFGRDPCRARVWKYDHNDLCLDVRVDADTPAEALLNALHEAVKK